MKKTLELKLIEINANIRALEAEYPDSFPLLCNYKAETAKRELVVEILQSLRKR